MILAKGCSQRSRVIDALAVQIIEQLFSCLDSVANKAFNFNQYKACASLFSSVHYLRTSLMLSMIRKHRVNVRRTRIDHSAKCG